MRSQLRSFSMIALLATAACGGAKEEAPAPAKEVPALPSDVTLALNVAKGISADPAAADSVLTANGLTRTGFDSLLYNIAADSVKSALYNAARQ